MDDIFKIPSLKGERLILDNIDYYQINANSYGFWVSGRIDTLDADTFPHPYIIHQVYNWSSGNIQTQHVMDICFLVKTSCLH